MQKYGSRKFALATALASFTLFLPPAFAASTQDDMRPVSYTHLTLPTILLV